MILETVSDIATVLTALVAGGAWLQFQWERRQRRVRLERHLRDVRDPLGSPATIPELMADLAMSEQDIMDAAFRSKRVVRRHRIEGVSGRTVAVEFDFDREPPRRF